MLVTRIDRLHDEPEIPHFTDITCTVSASVGDTAEFLRAHRPGYRARGRLQYLQSQPQACSADEHGSLRTNTSRLQALSTYVGERTAKAIPSNPFPIMVVSVWKSASIG